LGATVVLLIALLVAVLRLTKALKPPAHASAEKRARPGKAQVDVTAEPFEADGRWWFQRGEELLVYEAGTGEWVPASGTADVVTDQTKYDTASEPTITAEAAREPVIAPAHEGSDDGTFWRCPSCGAVNGSVSATCRMCFAAR
jgi:hypothetical protein